jgi:hypothetical protein
MAPRSDVVREERGEKVRDVKKVRMGVGRRMGARRDARRREGRESIVGKRA